MSNAASLNGGKRAHYFLIYHGGLTATMVLDHQIRSAPGNVFSLDYLMRELYVSSSRTKPYSNATLVKLIRTTTGYDAADFFEQYILGKKVIPVGAYFDLGMLELSHKLGLELGGSNQQVLADMLNIDTSYAIK